VVVVAFQIAFRAEIHVNDVFLFFKNHFWYQHIKTIQKVQTALNFSKKKKKKFENRWKAGWTAEPNAPNWGLITIYTSQPASQPGLSLRFLLALTATTKIPLVVGG
jgi:hypothetical protein